MSEPPQPDFIRYLYLSICARHLHISVSPISSFLLFCIIGFTVLMSLLGTHCFLFLALTSRRFLWLQNQRKQLSDRSVASSTQLKLQPVPFATRPTVPSSVGISGKSCCSSSFRCSGRTILSGGSPATTGPSYVTSLGNGKLVAFNCEAIEKVKKYISDHRRSSSTLRHYRFAIRGLSLLFPSLFGRFISRLARRLYVQLPFSRHPLFPVPITQLSFCSSHPPSPTPPSLTLTMCAVLFRHHETSPGLVRIKK
ncbi:hypothetical protein K474DRAFT_907400 [Panus rudis PR-1116 ss-1]|nr:hypothetical protein K474DRAFT_907400 [Panus rudis PR-1116 ss-1]